MKKKIVAGALCKKIDCRGQTFFSRIWAVRQTLKKELGEK